MQRLNGEKKFAVMVSIQERYQLKPEIFKIGYVYALNRSIVEKLVDSLYKSEYPYWYFIEEA